MWKELANRTNFSELYENLEKTYDCILKINVIKRIEKLIDIQNQSIFSLLFNNIKLKFYK